MLWMDRATDNDDISGAFLPSTHHVVISSINKSTFESSSGIYTMTGSTKKNAIYSDIA